VFSVQRAVFGLCFQARRLKAGSVISACWLTQRALDGGYAARFSAVFWL